MMVVIAKRTITEYGQANAQAAEALLVWYQIARTANWADFNALRGDMPATDYVGNERFTFNIKGNHYRLCALISFKTRTIYIKAIMNHAEYTKLSKAGKLSTL